MEVEEDSTDCKNLIDTWETLFSRILMDGHTARALSEKTGIPLPTPVSTIRRLYHMRKLRADDMLYSMWDVLFDVVAEDYWPGSGVLIECLERTGIEFQSACVRVYIRRCPHDTANYISHVGVGTMATQDSPSEMGLIFCFEVDLSPP